MLPGQLSRLAARMPLRSLFLQAGVWEDQFQMLPAALRWFVWAVAITAIAMLVFLVLADYVS